jgi:hypothetical protein
MINSSYYYSSSVHPRTVPSQTPSTLIPAVTFDSNYRTRQTPFYPSSYNILASVPQYSREQQLDHHRSSMKSTNFFRHGLFSSHSSSNNDTDEKYLYHEQQLERNLLQHGFRRLPVKGDGNCLFYALAEGLIYESQQHPQDFGMEIRHILHVTRPMDLTEFADRLRQLCVDQWRRNENYYSQFVDQEKVNFLKEVKKFSKNGVSESILGDIVPLTIANVLDIHITIFTSIFDLPRIDVRSERRLHHTYHHRKTIYLAYNQCGLGHYDAAYRHYSS